MKIDWSASVRRSPLGMLAIALLLLASGWFLFDALSDKRPLTATPTPTGSGIGLPTGTPAHPTPSASSPTTTGSPGPSSSPSPVPATPTPTAPPVGAVEMPFVPIAGFWTTERALTTEQLAAAVAGGGDRFARVALPAEDAAAIAAALGVELGAGVLTGTADDIRAAVRDGALGVLRLTDVDQRVRALDLDGLSLFGNERVASAADWPLRAQVVGPPVPDQSATWTLVAGGDILLARAVAGQIFTEGKGVDFPFDGGTARVTRIVCCSAFDWPIPQTERTGNAGAVRELFSGGDLAIANLETAVRDGARPRTGGLTFVAHPSTIDGVAGAGFDLLSLANNHIHNGGEQGVLTAIRELDERAIAHAGAGPTAADARQPAYLEVNGQQVAVLACSWVGGRFAQGGHVGANNCRDELFVNDIADAAARAGVVIVYPHWGREYQAQPAPYQRRLAGRWLDAGADMVIGAHSHWAGAIEEMDGRLVFYSLGNLVFDQSWSAQTQMGVILELTFSGDRVVQAWLHPTVILDQAQPNLLTTDEDIRRVLDQMRDGSTGLLPY